MKQRFYILIVLVGAVLASCSQYSNGRGAIAYHNLTAKYNAYIIARERMKEVETTLAQKRKDDFNQLMPILLPIDSVQAREVGTQIDDVIKKASLIPNSHQNSKWVDNALVLLGKARLYKGQYTDGIETLRYINTKDLDNDDTHTGLVWLMRAYVENHDFNNALSVAEYIRAKPLNKTNTRDFYLVKAYLHQQKGEYRLSTAVLEETFDLMPKNEEKARAHFAAAQMYDLLGQAALANEHYNDVLRNRPSYDLGFFARMNNLQNEALTNTNISTDKGFERLIEDRKNSDLRDRLYYTMGIIETRKSNYPKAIDLFRKSIQNTTINTTQVPYTYLEMARVYYEKLQNYEQAKAYYDSSLAVLPKTSADYNKIVERKQGLDEFVKHLTTIRVEDSLQRLSQMPPNTLDKFLDGLIGKQIEDEKKRIEEAQKLVASAQAQTLNNSLDGLSPDRFTLYDPMVISQGKIDFRQRWGTRVLEDNWRRNQKSASTLGNTSNLPQATAGTASNTPTVSNQLTKDSPEWKNRKSEMMTKIPFRKTEMDASNERIEDAYYKLGKIYKLNLNEPANAVKTFTEMLGRYPNTNYKSEVYYFLYLSNTDEVAKNEWKNKVLTEFPNSAYARLLTNKLAADVGGNLEEKALKDYENLLKLYQVGNFTESMAQLENAMAIYGTSKIIDKYAVLRIYLLGKLQGREPYLKALNDFLKDYPASTMLPRIREIIESQQATAKRQD